MIQAGGALEDGSKATAADAFEPERAFGYADVSGTRFPIESMRTS
jgi:hypothetical protein